MAYRILIVDAEAALQNMVKEILAQAGYETDSALSCAQALDRLGAAPPDAVLLDVTLPDGDGFSLLEKLEIPYDRVSSDPADNMEKCAAVSEVLGVPICKNLFLCNRQKTQFYLLCMGPDKPFHTKDLSHQISSARLSFAPEEELWELLHCTPGSATILGLMNDPDHRVRLLMEREVYEAEYLSCHPCICTSSLKLKTRDVLDKLLPYTGHDVTVVDL